MASMFSKWKHFTLSFIILSTALIFLITNYLYFTLNFNSHLQDEFQDVATSYLKRIKNPKWLEIIAREIKDEDTGPGFESTNGAGGQVQLHAEKHCVTTTSPKSVRDPKWFQVVAREFKDDMINVGLVNLDKALFHEVHTNVKMVNVRFNPVGDDIRWSDLAPERIDENSTCPDVPMPRFEDYGPLDVVVARVSRHSGCENGGLRDVFRLQVNLVVANLLARTGRTSDNRPVLAVFLGSCEPMWEIFRCDDLVWSEGNSRVYKPDLNRIKQAVLMPVGACQFVPPFARFGDRGPWRSYIHELGHKNHHHPTPPPPQREAYVTVLHSSENYVCGAVVLGQSIIQSNTTKDLILLADDSISAESLRGLRAAGWKTKRITRLRSPYSRAGAYNEWNYSKLRIWQLKSLYDKLIFLDADLVVNRNLDALFAYPQMTAAGNYQRHLFNSGLMVVEPSECAFASLSEKISAVESYNGGDQGFLNELFAWWHRLPAQTNYLKVFVDPKDKERLIRDDVYAVHYTGLKPWRCYGDDDCNWEVPEFRRYASHSGQRIWRRIYGKMPSELKKYCTPEKFGGMFNATSSPVKGGRRGN